MSLLALEGFSAGFPLGGGLAGLILGAQAPALEVVSAATLTVAAGETVALVGESGSGKTTLARAVLGLTPSLGGTLAFRGERVGRAADFRRLRRATGVIFQDAVSSLSPRLTVGALLAEPFRIQRRALPEGGAEAMLAGVGLPPETARRRPHELSGGQARRVGVARALALGPALVIADEPTAGLDVSVQGGVMNLMAERQREAGFGMLLVTHNLAVARRVADRAAVMYLGRIVEEGAAAAVLGAPAHPYTRALVDSEPHPDPARRRAAAPMKGEPPSLFARPPGCHFHPRCAAATAICRSAPPRERRLSDGRRVACHHPLTA